MAMDFPISELMDEQACYDWLVSVLHPGGLACPGCGEREDKGGLTVHRRNRTPVLVYRCRPCGRVFNAYAGTPLSGTPRRPSQLVMLLRGFAKGETTAALARELGFSRGHLLELRHELQANAAAALTRVDPARLTDDTVAEADEMYQAAGEKRPPPHRPRRPSPASREQGKGPRVVGQRPASGPRRRRPGHGKAAAGSRAS